MTTSNLKTNASPTYALDDATLKQIKAAQPSKNVWVNASAGTGKTKVLVDRLLRLLLPRDSKEPGTEPHKILCLTFTKAAASEMAIRINKTLAKWSIMDEEALIKDLTHRFGTAPLPDQVRAAKNLFSLVIDSHGGIKIMTIHAFCQSVLGRFPLEAGVSPNFSTLDETQSSALLTLAQNEVIKAAKKNADSLLGQSFYNLASIVNETQFLSLLHSIASERLQLEKCLENINYSNSKVKESLKETFDIPLSINKISDLNALIISDKHINIEKLKAAINDMSQSGKVTDQNISTKISEFLSLSEESREDRIEDYISAFLTQKGDIKARLITNSCKNKDIHLGTLSTEAIRVYEWYRLKKSFLCFLYNFDLIILAQNILEIYSRKKEELAALDYDDLIAFTDKLLEGDISQALWVMFKLDEGIDHVLIDEAQDTNPEQWNIIKALTHDFISGKGAKDYKRTIFTVGDEKQSIYSFQRASPKHFDTTKKYYSKRIIDGSWETVELNTSFRSSPSVLKLVDMVFNDHQHINALGKERLEHVPFRELDAGHVELWPLLEDNISDQDSPWLPPIKVKDITSGQAQLAEKIADKIKRWIDKSTLLPSKDRPIEAGDILILVRTRTSFVNRMVRALKRRSIPVSGLDRMKLNDQIAVQDMVSLAQFCILPYDDLNLACLLKSPFIGWSEQMLYDLAISRKSSLWEALQLEENHELLGWLNSFIYYAKTFNPYEFFTQLLQSPCPGDPNGNGISALCSRLGEDAIDPIEEFINTTLSYELDNIPTLQGFLSWHQNHEVTIKRELEEAGNHVRIMTVHAAKGLQAPIVFLPDTTRTPASKKTPRIIWPDKSGFPLPVWSPNTNLDCDSYKKAKDLLEAKMDEEYKRLLYVALTRAEDRLYICGHSGKTKPIDESWYNYISSAFTKIDDVAHKESEEFENIKYFSNKQLRTVEKRKESASLEAQDIKIPKWLNQNIKAQPVATKTLYPSTLKSEEPAVFPPGYKGDTFRFKRGVLTHKLLQILPNIDMNKRREVACKYIAKPQHALPTKIQNEIVEEVLNIINSPTYSSLFGPNSLAEVPICGNINKNIVSGKIDRLLITENEVWVVDYKTNRPPPKEPSLVAETYISQMHSYQSVLKTIYSKHKIRSFLFWTDGPIFMEITKIISEMKN